MSSKSKQTGQMLIVGALLALTVAWFAGTRAGILLKLGEKQS